MTRSTVDAITADQLELPTPCADMNVRELQRHLHMAIARAATIPTLGDPTDLPVEDETIGDAAWPQAIDAVAASAATTWADDALLSTEMQLPWMQAPGAEVLGVYLNEVIVHTWDLATATGQSPRWLDADVELALEAISRQLPTADRAPMWEAAKQSLPPELLAGRPWADPFADAVDVPADAGALARLVAWNGRRP